MCQKKSLYFRYQKIFHNGVTDSFILQELKNLIQNMSSRSWEKSFPSTSLTLSKRIGIQVLTQLPKAALPCARGCVRGLADPAEPGLRADWPPGRRRDKEGVSTGLVEAVRPYFALAGERRMGEGGEEMVTLALISPKFV